MSAVSHTMGTAPTEPIRLASRDHRTREGKPLHETDSKITDTGWVHALTVHGEQLRAQLCCAEVSGLVLGHNLTLWHDPNAAGWPNATAMLMLRNWASMAPETIPLLTGDVILLGRHPNGHWGDLSPAPVCTPAVRHC